MNIATLGSQRTPDTIFFAKGYSTQRDEPESAVVGANMVARTVSLISP